MIAIGGLSTFQGIIHATRMLEIIEVSILAIPEKMPICDLCYPLNA